MLFQTVMATANPFVGKRTTTTINTPIMSLSVNRCGNSRRRRRRATTAVGLSHGSSTLVEINIPPSTLGLQVNATPTSDNDGIVTSQFNLTTPGSVPLVIRITAITTSSLLQRTSRVVIRISPSRPSRVNAFVRRNAVPTTSDYDWLLTSSNDTDNYTVYIAASDYDWLLTSSNDTDNYTLYIAASETNDVTHVYVGVQSSGGLYSLAMLEKSRRFYCCNVLY